VRAFDRWPGERPIRLVETGGGTSLLVVAALPSDGSLSAALLYSFGAFLPFLALHSYLDGDLTRR
jgi:hypothetical protein